VVAWHRRRLLSLASLSVVGLVVALAFVRLAAPDLALAMLTRPFDTISGWHVANSLPGGGGRNIVNVILVDFRGFDTLGEVAVLGMAGLSIRAMLAGLSLPPTVPSAAAGADRHPVMLAMLMQPMLPLLLAAALFLFLRGHNLPGGGFVAGLIIAIAILLQYVARGIDFADARLRFNAVVLLGLGLALCVVTGLVPLLLGRPFLTSAHGHAHLPLIGDIELASAMAFDGGILVVVVAAMLLALLAFGRLSSHEPGGARAG